MDASLYPALKTAILAETDPEFVGYRTNGQTTLMAGWLNTNHASELAWDADSAWASIFDAIDGSLYTPPAAQVQAATDTVATKLLLCNLLKLTIQQNMLLAMQSADARRPDTRAAILDSVTGVYTLNAYNRTNPGGTSGGNVAASMVRPVRRGELIFGGATSTAGGITARTLTWEGFVTDSDISAALQG